MSYSPATSQLRKFLFELVYHMTPMNRHEALASVDEANAIALTTAVAVAAIIGVGGCDVSIVGAGNPSFGPFLLGTDATTATTATAIVVDTAATTDATTVATTIATTVAAAVATTVAATVATIAIIVIATATITVSAIAAVVSITTVATIGPIATTIDPTIGVTVTSEPGFGPGPCLSLLSNINLNISRTVQHQHDRL
ncbi:hypothetical protein FRB95_013808 [Tulasnella sp. JGI-2019a]|nr:hypothetical protein FRB95_013808 [Tulasnella sp. JGI-2019a]